MVVKSEYVCMRKICKTWFYPGNNTIDAAEYAILKVDKVFKGDVEAGKLKVVNKSSDSIADMDVASAVKVVSEILSRPELDEIIATEKRAKVVKAAEIQLEKIKNQP